MEKPVYASIPLGLHFEINDNEIPLQNSGERNYVFNNKQFATIVTTSRSSCSNDNSPSQNQLTLGMSQLSLSKFVAAYRRDKFIADLSQTVHFQSNENSLLWFTQPSFSSAFEVSHNLCYDTSSHNQLKDPTRLSTIELTGNNDFPRTPVSLSFPGRNFYYFSWNEPDLYVERTNLYELGSYQGSNPIVNSLAAQLQNNVGSDPSLTNGVSTRRPLHRSKHTPYKCPKCPCEFAFSENLDAHMADHWRIEAQTNLMISSDSASRWMNSDSPMLHSQFTWNLKDLEGTEASSSNYDGETFNEDYEKEEMAREKAFPLANNAENEGQPTANLDTEDAVSSIIKSIKEVAI